MSEKTQLPTLAELRAGNELQTVQKSQFLELVNNPPEDDWVKAHPIAKMDVIENGKKKKVPIPYLPVERVEWLLTQIFFSWSLEIKSVQLLANSIVVVIRLHYINPVTGVQEYQDGVGAVALQTDSGHGATDFNALKHDSVMKAAPAAESYALKDAAEKIGRIFGTDLGRKEKMNYSGMSKKYDYNQQLADLKELYGLKEESCTSKEKTDIERIIENQETESYSKAIKLLKGK